MSRLFTEIELLFIKVYANCKMTFVNRDKDYGYFFLKLAISVMAAFHSFHEMHAGDSLRFTVKIL
jgi:hypothetical protein